MVLSLCSRIMFRNTGAAAEVDFSHAGDRYQRTSLMTIRPDDVTASVAACGGSLDGDESDEDDDDTEGDFFAQATYSSDSDIITGLDPLPDHAGFTSSRLTGASGAASGRSSRRSKSRTASTASAGGAASVAARLSFTRSTGRASAAGRSNSSSWRAAESRVQRDADASPYVPRKLRSELTRSASVRTKRPAVITARRPPDASDAVADASATDATIDCSAAFPSLADVEEQLRMQREQHRTKYMSMMSNERLRSLTCGDSVSNKNGFVPPAARQTEKQDDAAASTTATAAVAIAAEVDDGNDTSSSASEKSDAASDAIDAAAFATPPKETHEKSRTLGCTPPLLVMEDEGAAEARQLSAASSGSSPLSPVESSTMDQLVRHIDDALLPAEEVEERISFMESAAFAAGADDGTSAYGIMADAREVARGTEAANQARQDSQEQSNSAGAAASKVDGIASIDAVIGEKHNATKLLLQQQSFAESMAHGSRTLTLSESEQSLPSLLAVGNVAQAMIQYVGDADYRNLSVLQNIELYFKEQVFGSQRPSGKHPFLKYGAAASVKGSAGADGRERLFVRAPSGQSERFVALYFEKVIRSSVRKPAPSYESMKDQQKLTPRRERKSLFRTSSSTGSGRGGGSGNAKGAAAAGIVETEQRQEVELYIAHTDHSVYFINRFVDPKAMFCDAPLLSVEAAHPLYALWCA